MFLKSMQAEYFAPSTIAMSFEMVKYMLVKSRSPLFMASDSVILNVLHMEKCFFGGLVVSCTLRPFDESRFSCG